MSTVEETETRDCRDEQRRRHWLEVTIGTKLVDLIPLLEASRASHADFVYERVIDEMRSVVVLDGKLKRGDY